jgi:beta-phosphoglucomutase-like phosphatase (HAD superfamily)
MNNLIIFDLDGVLIDSRDMHYEALNRALEKVDPKYIIHKR